MFIIQLLQLALYLFAINVICDRIGGWLAFWVIAALIGDYYLERFMHWVEKEEIREEYDKAAKRDRSTKKGNPQVGEGQTNSGIAVS